MNQVMKDLLKFLKLLLSMSMRNAQIGISVNNDDGENERKRIFVIHYYGGEINEADVDIRGWKTTILDSNPTDYRVITRNHVVGPVLDLDAPVRAFGMSANTISEVLDRAVQWINNGSISSFQIWFRQCDDDEWRALTVPLHCR